jgi:hypothetical protein
MQPISGGSQLRAASLGKKETSTSPLIARDVLVCRGYV